MNLIDDKDTVTANLGRDTHLVNQIAKHNNVQRIEDEVVIKSLELIHNGLYEKLSVKELAHKCYMSPDGFIRRFHRIVGTTPHAYMKNIRLRTARCLRESGMNISRIADEVGYSDASSLLHALQNEDMRSG
jgi:transcriptional regulator GlxA family with amidase domain